MKFFKEELDLEKFVDAIFPVVQAAKKDNDSNCINATAGCLYDDEGKLFTYKTVFENEAKLSANIKAAYAASPAGNNDYRQAISKYFLEDRVSNNYTCIASAGGTGAIYLALNLCLENGDTLIYPEIAWGNYKSIARENNLKSLKYDVYNLESLFNCVDSVNGKVCVLINSPCENPLGHAYSFQEWEKIFDKLNNLNKEVILLLDIAYLDYSNQDPKAYFSLFNKMSDNVLVLMAASCSKSFSYYGERLGALIAIHNDKTLIENLDNYATRLTRTTWSNVNNGAMINVADVLNNHYEEYIAERDASIRMLKTRADLFLKEAKENNLITYPYEDGFFITLKIEDNNLRDQIHQIMIDEHIYTIKVNKGLRIAICSIPLKKISGLAKRMKECYE